MDECAASDSKAKSGCLRHLKIRPGFIAVVAMFFLAIWWMCVHMPGKSFTGPLPAVTHEQERLRASLERWLMAVAGDVGARSTTNPSGLDECLAYLEAELRAMGYSPSRETYEVQSIKVSNLVAARAGSVPSAGTIVVGAHYDAFLGSPGANDNGSGVVALLALAERFKDAEPDRSLRFVFFTNEEPPHFQQPSMGSLVYAEECRERDEDIRAMWSLETLAYYTDEEDTQRYPSVALGLAYPTRGNFVAFVGNVSSRGLVRTTIGRFRKAASFPSEGAALPGWIAGVGWSDHWSFARVGYPALMVTDTAVFRDPEYHTFGDRPERLNLEGLARVTLGLGDVLEQLLGVTSGL